jgi:asparagine synthase (glutamine-hydrolysing)
MCGFVGGVDTRMSLANLQRLTHRGPDQIDFTTRVCGGRQLTLGQVRLSIVDRRDIPLPISVTRGDRSATILFNGEIYNWRELRAELEQEGFCFQTETDTEVALAAYFAWGEACLNRFNGMFAFAIWDGQRFFCARDRLGKKPFFYRSIGGRFEFASEIKAFSDLVFEGNEVFDLFEFCPDEHTLFRGIFSLPPGHLLVFEPGRDTLERRAYWNLPISMGQRLSDPEEAVDRFVELLSDSVRLRMRADVPVTAFLSGGLDSTLIAVLGNVKSAFTCQFDEFKTTIDEELYARDFADRMGIELTVVRPTRAQFMEDLPKLAWHLEQPTGSSIGWPRLPVRRASS